MHSTRRHRPRHPPAAPWRRSSRTARSSRSPASRGNPCRSRHSQASIYGDADREEAHGGQQDGEAETPRNDGTSAAKTLAGAGTGASSPAKSRRSASSHPGRRSPPRPLPQPRTTPRTTLVLRPRQSPDERPDANPRTNTRLPSMRCVSRVSSPRPTGTDHPGESSVKRAWRPGPVTCCGRRAGVGTVVVGFLAGAGFRAVAWPWVKLARPQR
jgi:hypothetical protein